MQQNLQSNLGARTHSHRLAECLSIADITSHQASHRRRGDQDKHFARDVRAHHRSHEFSLWRGEVPIPKGWSPSVVPGARTVATQLLSPEKVVERLRSSVHPLASEHFGAFYSSELGGIITDPGMMFIHADDHMVHRGHGVFDTVLITDGHLYQLDEHMARFKKSAEAAGITFNKSEETLKRILLDTAAASRKLNGILKFWATTGRGGFGLSVRECTEPGFYAVATSETVPKQKAMDRTKGYRACVASVLPAEPPFCNIKSNNYLRNAMAQQDAEASGYDIALFVDSQGYVQEGPTANIAILTQEDELVTPPFDGCLAGVTIQRLMELIPAAVKKSPDDVIVKSMSQRPIKLSDVLAAKEAFLTGSTTRVMSIVSVGEDRIADGMPGLTSLALDALLLQDMDPSTPGPEGRHIKVPYGFMTGMKEQLA